MPAVNGFIQTVLRSGLLSKEQLREALRELPRDRRRSREAVADWLVKNGRLSRFQARKLLAGTALGLVLGPFQVLAPIGKGGMGTVYLSRDTRSQQLVALKVLPPRRAREEPRVLARFRREMEMCQRVAHPHLAWTHEVGLYQGVYFIAMEYIPGKNLYRLVADQGPLSIPRAARIFGEVAAALEHTHGQGIIHRDLKPSNIIITPHDHAKLLDLGLALVEGEPLHDREVLGGQGYVVGTMDYLAPEQAADACGVDPRCDLYALGCTLYFALTGRPPFPEGTNREKIQSHRTEEPVALTSLNHDVPPGFAALVEKLMAKDRDRRFDSAAAVRQELAKWTGNEPVKPLDHPSDASFRAAVTVVESAEPVDDATPLEPAQPPPRRRGRPPVLFTKGAPQRAATAAPPRKRPYFLFVLLGGVGTAILVVSVLLYLLAVR